MKKLWYIIMIIGLFLIIGHQQHLQSLTPSKTIVMSHQISIETNNSLKGLHVLITPEIDKERIKNLKTYLKDLSVNSNFCY